MAEMRTTDTAGGRRLVYGLNVVIAVLVSIVLVVAVNWIIDRAYRKAPGSVRDVLRADMTATRRYSLSQQTRKLLDNIEKDVKIYVLLVAEAEEFRLASELIDEYGRYGNNVSVETIYTATSPARLDAFYETIRQRYADQLKPIRDAIDTAKSALTQAGEEASRQSQDLVALSENKELPAGEIQQAVFILGRRFGMFDEEFQALAEDAEKRLEQPLPNYQSVLSDLRSALTTLDQQQYALAVQAFETGVQDPSIPGNVKETLLATLDTFKASRKQIQEAVSKLEGVESPEAYEDLRRQVNDRNAIVLMDEDQERVINVRELFRAGEQTGEEDEVKPVFLGEEKITGALTSMSLEKDPLVVFCTTGSMDPLSRGARDGYYWVAQSLMNAHFDVQTWNPMPRQQPGMPPMPGQEPPQPEPGQPTVWVFIQSPQMGPANPMAGMADGQVISHIRQRVAEGDGAMMILTYSLMPNMGGAQGSGAFDGMLADWGMTAQLDRVICQQVTLPDRTKRAIPQYEVDDWPDATPITAALGGMPGMFAEASPIIVESEEQPDAGPETTKQQNVEHWPLVVVDQPQIWAATNYVQYPDIEYDKTTAKEQFTIAVAAQNGEGHRVAVFADPHFATNLLTQGMIDPINNVRFVQHPANSELFVNSVYWLAGLDEYIAAGARSQDIRRVDASMSKVGETWIEVILVAGLPLLVIAAGIGVWFVRRSG